MRDGPSPLNLPPPNEEFLAGLSQQAENLSEYSTQEFETILHGFRQTAERELQPEVRAAQESIVSTVESIYHANPALKRQVQVERGGMLGEISHQQRIAITTMAYRVMHTAEALTNRPDMLKLFWEKIYTPMLLNKYSSLNEAELRAITESFMGELATIKGLNHVFQQHRPNLTAYKGLPEEDVEDGNDIIVAAKNDNGQREYGVQIKLWKEPGMREDMNVSWQETGTPPLIKLQYRREVAALFDTSTGEPSQQFETTLKVLSEQLGRSNSFRAPKLKKKLTRPTKATTYA